MNARDGGDVKAPGGPRGLRALSFFAALLLLPAAKAAAAPAADASTPAEPPALTAALSRARAAHLADEKAWLRLGHYRGHPGSWVSEADGPALFLAPDGARNPEAELEATLRGFYGPTPVAPPGANPRDPRLKHPLCRFPARLLWLMKTVPLDAQALPNVRCPEMEDFLTRTSPRGAVLVFSAYYMNNPASAFGHTFLRLRNGQPGSHDLLDYGIDFSADVDTTNALLYGIKGLTGLFPGTFKRLPYYYKVREYNDYESRDLWEYELNLSDEALMMLVMHIWELGSSYFDYYYLDENCSYHILGVIEAADPRLDLLDHVGFPVIPADTVKALFANPKLVRRVHFRPSLRSQLRERMKHLSGSEKDLVAKVAVDPGAPLPASFTREEQARVLDAALDVVDVRYARKLVEKTDQRPADLKQALMTRRAMLGIATAAPAPVPPLSKRPERAHGAARVGTALGATNHRQPFQSMDFRLALHDFADAAAGLPDGAQLEFMAGRLRFWPGPRQLDLEDLTIFRAISLTPLDRFDLQPSWTLSVGAATRRYDCDSCLAGRTTLGGGGALALGQAAEVFALGTVEGLYGPHAPWRWHLRGGVGGTAGLLLHAGSLSLVTTGELTFYPFEGEPRRFAQARAIARWTFRGAYALSLEAGVNSREADGRAGALVYF